MLADLKRHLLKAQQIMKQQANHHCRDMHFNVGEKVYLNLRSYRQKILARRRNKKLSPRYFGSYEIEERIRVVAYHLKLPSSSPIHLVFHVSQLKKAIGDITSLTSTLPPTLTEGHGDFVGINKS